jgi:hypothetical protein
MNSLLTALQGINFTQPNVRRFTTTVVSNESLPSSHHYTQQITTNVNLLGPFEINGVSYGNARLFAGDTTERFTGVRIAPNGIPSDGIIDPNNGDFAYVKFSNPDGKETTLDLITGEITNHGVPVGRIDTTELLAHLNGPEGLSAGWKPELEYPVGFEARPIEFLEEKLPKYETNFLSNEGSNEGSPLPPEQIESFVPPLPSKEPGVEDIQPWKTPNTWIGELPEIPPQENKKNGNTWVEKLPEIPQQ